MGLFDFIKKKSQTILNPEVLDAQVVQDDNLEHLTKDGELPWGWIYKNKEFTDKINNEYSYFLNAWLNSKNKSPMERYAPLKSFVLYLEDVQKLCVSKGECFELWFYECIASKDYIEKRKNELNHLVVNMDSLQEHKVQKQKEEEKQKRIVEMKSDVILLLKENDGILQSDFWKLFDDEMCRMAASEIVYALTKEGKIERIKSGRTYTLHYKG